MCFFRPGFDSGAADFPNADLAIDIFLDSNPADRLVSGRNWRA
jgi:hypothetical protein